MEKSRTALENEMDLVKLIRSQRFIHMALKHLLEPVIHKKFQQESKLLEIEIEEDFSSLANINE